MAWLLQQSGAQSRPAANARDQAATWLRAAGGRPTDALNWARLGLTAQQWARLPAALTAGDGSVIADWAPAQQLDVLQKLCHDLMATQAGGAPRFFEAADLPKPGQPFALQEWSAQLMQAARHVEHPVGAGLMLEAWMAQARQALKISADKRRQ